MDNVVVAERHADHIWLKTGGADGNQIAYSRSMIEFDT
jgi:hypothetical protein